MNKNIRRILSAVLSLAMTLSLAACGEKNSSAQPGSTGADGEEHGTQRGSSRRAQRTGSHVRRYRPYLQRGVQQHL